MIWFYAGVVPPGPATESPVGSRYAESLLRVVPAADSAAHAHAIARLCAIWPLGNVQRNLQRCLRALPHANSTTSKKEIQDMGKFIKKNLHIVVITAAHLPILTIQPPQRLK